MLLRLTRVDRSCGEYAELHGAGRSWVDDAFLPDEMGLSQALGSGGGKL